MANALPSPKFGKTEWSAHESPISAKQGLLPVMNDSRAERVRRAQSGGLPGRESEPGPIPGLGEDRAEVSMSLSVRYMQLRDQVIRDRKILKSLRDDFATRQESLKVLNEASKEEQISMERLQEINRALTAIAETINSHDLHSATLRMDVMRRELGKTATWNYHIASLLAFLEAQQLSVERQPIGPVVNSRRSKSPLRHWSP
jgi:hypothetical protein